MKLFSVFSGCFRLFSVVLLLSVVFGIHKDRLLFNYSPGLHYMPDGLALQNFMKIG